MNRSSSSPVGPQEYVAKLAAPPSPGSLPSNNEDMFSQLLWIHERDVDSKASATLQTKAPESKRVAGVKDFSPGSWAWDTGLSQSHTAFNHSCS